MVEYKRSVVAGMLICLTFFISIGCQTSTMKQESINTYAIRLKPGEDLRESIEKLVKEKNIEAGWIVSCAGSLTVYSIRFANQPEASAGNGHFEIVSLGGTISIHGSHLHISISDSTGKTTGGHLMPGCKIYTTAEIVIQSSKNFVFKREKDGSTPWEELQVKERSNPPGDK